MAIVSSSLSTKTRYRKFAVPILSLMALASEIALLVGLSFDRISIVQAGILHLGCIILLGMLVHSKFLGPERQGIFWLITFLIIAGPFGVLFVMPMMIGRFLGKRRTGDQATGYEVLVEVPNSDPISQLCEQLRDGRLNLDEPKPMSSLAHTIEFGQQSEQLNALRVIGFNFDPSFSTALLSATVNRDAAVRVMAATVLAKLKKDYTNKINDCKNAIGHEYQSASDLYDLAHANLDYAESNLLEARMAQTLTVETRNLANWLDGHRESDALQSRRLIKRITKIETSLAASSRSRRDTVDKRAG